MKYASTLKLKLIYVFRINDEPHQGCLKIGEATETEGESLWGLQPNSTALNKAAKDRINQYTQTAGIAYDLLYTEVSVYAQRGTLKSFSDDEVHQVLLRSGIKRKDFGTKNQGKEWFLTDLETVKNAIKAVKEGRLSLNSNERSVGQNPIVFRPEQQDAIAKTVKRFGNATDMLWNAKMRFGKTLSALQVVKEMQYKRTLILTHRPVVDEGWFEDFGKIFYDQPQYQYGSKTNGESFKNLEKRATTADLNYIYFASMQDLRGSAQVGGNFDKNNEIFSASWDLIIIDEAHEGTQTELGQNVIHALREKKTRVLQLSGTPFNLLDEFKEEEIYTWDYVMEQAAKMNWDKNHFGDPNPYTGLPRMNIYTFDLGALMPKFKDETVAFNFHEFFRVKEEGGFVHQTDIAQFLNLICKKDENTNYPYATEEFQKNFRHSLWMVPGVKEARELSKLLKSHLVFSHFDIVNVAGDGDEEEASADALAKVETAIGKNPEETYTITLSCGRLTTGVTVRPWTAVFMLAGSYNTQAQSYMQTIFRVQSPATINGKVKEECFVFDFAPDRTLKVIAETAKISRKAGQTSGGDREALGAFLNFCPIIGMTGTRMLTYDVNRMMEQLKKVYVERVVRNGFEDGYLYNNDKLMQLDGLALEDFKNLKNIIGATKAMPKAGDVDMNKQGFTDEEYEQLKKARQKKKQELTEEEKRILEEQKEKSKNRKTAISILRGISIRMPLMIYGADITDEDKELTIDNFADLVDPQSWEEFMPRGVTKAIFKKFKPYYEEDVFRAAGKRIRAMARAADQLTIEERIGRITHIFSTFRNPDKETVLTPWRVVNMHLGDCLGGYEFYDERRENVLDQPRYVTHGEVTDEVFGSDAKILEINAKTGLYSLYMAYGIYRNRIEALTAKDLSIEQGLQIWDETVRENIFALCKTPMAKAITQRTLIGFRNAKVNTRFFEDLINQIKNKPDKFVRQIKNGKTYWKANNNEDMKFNAIVGNPPYQEMDGGSGVSAKPIYQEFVEISKKIKPDYISMIMPARWYSGGKGLNTFRESMLQDTKIEKLYDFFDSTDVFPNVDISGGICYFLWNINNEKPCEITAYRNGFKTMAFRNLLITGTDVFIRFNEGVSILKKVGISEKNNFSSLVSSRKPFGLATNEIGDKKGEGELLDMYAYPENLKIAKNKIKVNVPWINTYKVFISYAYGERGSFPYFVLGKPFVGQPNTVCTETYLIIGPFGSEETCVCVMNYIRTKFFRSLVLLKKNTQHATSTVYQYVPLQDFTSSSDIDWSKSIPEIDQQLYQKYGLTEEEIAFIESMIKPME